MALIIIEPPLPLPPVKTSVEITASLVTSSSAVLISILPALPSAFSPMLAVIKLGTSVSMPKLKPVPSKDMVSVALIVILPPLPFPVIVLLALIVPPLLIDKESVSIVILPPLAIASGLLVKSLVAILEILAGARKATLSPSPLISIVLAVMLMLPAFPSPRVEASISPLLASNKF